MSPRTILRRILPSLDRPQQRAHTTEQGRHALAWWAVHTKGVL